MGQAQFVVRKKWQCSCFVYLGLALAGCEAGNILGSDTGKATIALGQTTDNNANTVGTTAPSDTNVPVSNSNAQAAGGAPNSNNAVVAQNQGPGVAIYWGTGNTQGKDANFAAVCNAPQYDIIIISFAYAIGSKSRNSGGYPEMSISGCGGAYNGANPYLPDCSAVGAIIPACQAAGKKVILSLGGGGASVGFKSDAEATAYAKMMWDLVLGGSGTVRPFGQAILDGIDLDIENDSALGYGAFVKALRALMDADGRKKYLITAAPQCVFPDAWMGPDDPTKASSQPPPTALSMMPEAFDHLFIQFYNNDCRWANPSYFSQTYAQWSTLQASKQPKIWIGLPGAKNAAMAEDFVPVSQLPALVKAGAARASYGGVMLWDAGYDLVDAAPGARPYSESIAQAHNALILVP